MARKATHLKFTEDELADPKVKKAAGKAAKAADKADRAAAKTPRRRKLKVDSEKAAQRKVHLTFEKEEIPAGELIGRGNRFTRSATHRTGAAVSGTIHSQVSQSNQDDNAAVDAVDKTTGTAETGAHTIDHAVYSRKLKSYEKTEKLQAKSDSANVEAIYQKRKAEHPEDFSNPISRWQQKRAIQKEYTAARRAEETAAQTANAAKNGGSGLSSIGKKLSDLKDRAFEYAAEHPQLILLIAAFAVLMVILSSTLSSCSAFFQGGSGAVIASSYTAKDEDIIGANDDYKALEAALQAKINNIETTHPGYDEYKYDVDEIGHDPYQLASYLTVLFEAYTREQVQDTLHTLFDLQYELTLTETVEQKTRTETKTGTRQVTDPITGVVTEEEYTYEEEVEYDYHILNVTLRNKNLGVVITNSGGMTDDQAERYALLLQTKGNKPDLFADDAYVARSGDYLDYDIPGEALTDARFANMIREAEKYLGYPYVWGGASPSTSFDCSGFVSWVINNCGNGWSVGRLTANGLKDMCQIIPASEAKPGDLIFFQGTYNTSGASHVGIYVGNGMMIHCGNPIQYASVNTPYWQSHFYCYGRIPN